MTAAPTPRELEEKVAAGMRTRLSVNVLRHAPQVGHGWLNELSVALAADALAVVREALAEPSDKMVTAVWEVAHCDRPTARACLRAALSVSPLRAAP